MDEREAAEPADVEGYADADDFDDPDEELDVRARGGSAFGKCLLAFAIAAVVFFFVGVHAGNNGWSLRLPGGASQEEEAKVSDLPERMAEVARLLDRDALFEYDAQAATDAALDALMQSGEDEYSEYFDKDYYRNYLSVTSGSFEGIGVVLGDYGRYVLITYVYPGSPAERAGIEAGDAFISIDGVEREWTSTDVVAALKREVGQMAHVALLRPNDETLEALAFAVYEDGKTDPAGTTAREVALEGERYECDVEFAKVDIQVVDHELRDGVGYIALRSFTLTAGKDVEAAVRDLLAQGARSFVLDLRNNGGGYVDQAVAVVSLFLPQGDVVSTRQKSGTVVTKVTGNCLTDLPLVVLVNDKSASASEITAVALKDNKRATIVGTKTFGKGQVQEIAPLSYGGALKYTIGEYTGPAGTAIDKVGITPDVVVEPADGFVADGSGPDVQLERALELARQQQG